MKAKKLSRAFYNRPTLEVAVDLLGKIFVYEHDGLRLGGRLVEVEAYIGEDDPACHAYRGMTPRNEIMYSEPGYLYVYFTYGNHYMLNIVTERKGFPAAVLLRGLEPLFGIEAMKANRGVDKLSDIASGPGKMAKALGITLAQKGEDLTGKRIYLLDDELEKGEICQSPRIGLSDGKDRLWRFFLANNPNVSKMSSYVKAGAVRLRSRS